MNYKVFPSGLESKGVFETFYLSILDIIFVLYKFRNNAKDWTFHAMENIKSSCY